MLYLSFDDGPHPTWTSRVLALLDRHGVTVTFFVVGRSAEAHPDLVAEILAAGHRVANHTYSHPSAARVPPEVFAADVARADRVLATLTGAPSPCLRPPYGAAPKRAGAVTDKEVVLWDVDPRDWERPGAAAIVARARAQVHPGAIVLFHDGGGDRAQTVAALEVLLPEWAAAGFTFGLLCPHEPPR